MPHQTVSLPAALGPTAWALWQDLQIEAAPDGTVAAKRADLASVRRTSLRSLDRALARLEAAGLVASVGPAGTTGRWMVHPDKETSRDVSAWVTSRMPQPKGGRRRGAGRPAKSMVARVGTLATIDFPSENHPEINGGEGGNQSGEGSGEINGGEGTPHENNQSGEAGHLTNGSVTVCDPVPTIQVGERNASPRKGTTDLPSLMYPSGIHSFGIARADARECNTQVEQAERERLMAKFGPARSIFADVLAKIPAQPLRRHGTLQQLSCAGLIPGFPGKHVLATNWFSRAKLLPADEDGAADADLLWGAFQSVARFRGARAFAGGWNRRDRARSDRGAPIERLTSLPEAALRLAAQAMRDCDVEPIAWVWWSWEVWVRGAEARGQTVRAKTPPPLRWLFNAERVHERSGWFRSETSRFRVVRSAPWPRAVRDLWCRYQTLLDAVRGRHPEDDVLVVRAEVRRAFPDTWERHLKRAQDALAAQAQEIREAVEAGTFLW